MRLNHALLASGCGLPALLAAGLAFAAPPESDEPILIVQTNWTSQIVLAEVAGEEINKADPTPTPGAR